MISVCRIGQTAVPRPPFRPIIRWLSVLLWLEGIAFGCTPAITDLTSARAQSLAERRLMLVFLYDGSTFSSQEKASIRQLREVPSICTSFIFVDLEVNSPEAPLVRQLKIQVLPAISVLMATSESHLTEVTRFEGRHSFRELREMITADTCEAASAGEISLPRSTAAALGCDGRKRGRSGRGR